MAIAGINHLWFYLLILTSTLAISRSDDPGDCVYTFYIQTAPFLFAGTDSKVTAIFSDRGGNQLQIGNIETWGGKMGSGYNYFEAGKLDTFSGKAPCLPGPICSLNLTIDGKGNLPAWYPNYLELTTTGDKTPCAKQLFTVNQWLGPPFSFSNSAVKNNCRRKAAVMKEEDSNDSSSGWPSFFADGVAF